MQRGILSVLVVAILSATISSCKKDKDTFTPPEPFFVSFEIDGAEIRYEDGENNYGNGPGINWYPDSLGILYSQLTTFIRSSFDPNYVNDILTIQMAEYVFDSVPPTYNESIQLFAEGTYAYGGWSDVATNLGVDGAILTYTDSNGRIWTSDSRGGDQENWASFEITDHATVEQQQYGARTKGTFECRVYDGTGNHLDLRNGSFYARTIFKTE